MTPQEMIEVLQAFEAGKAIEFRHKNDCSSCWFSCTPSWDFASYDYRVKPVPMTVWLNMYETHFGWAYKTKEAADSVCQPGGKSVKFIQADEQ